MYKKIAFTTMLTSILLASTFTPIYAKPAVPVTTYEFNYAQDQNNYFGSSSGATITRNGVTFIEVKELLVGRLGLKLHWDQNRKQATFDGFMKEIVLRIGSHTATIDSKSITMNAAPFTIQNPITKQKDIYVPIRAVVQFLGGHSLRVNPQNHVIIADQLQAFNVITDVYQGNTYTMKKINGDLYRSYRNHKPVKIASIHNALDFFEFSNIDVSSTSKGLQIIRIQNASGEPHIYHEDFTMIFKNGSLIRQSSMDYHLNKHTNSTMYNGNIILNDGQNLRIIEDGTGNVLENIDLVKLAGKKDRYVVESLQSDIVLLQAISDSHLTLIDRKTGHSVVLYKELLTTEQQKLVDPTTMPFGIDDRLTYVKRIHNRLYFTYGKDSEDEQQVTYTLK
ncbi:copper amine oxidase N-terminal domain-containing protein [Paenibacillus sp. PK4536]|uniref:copper amine oxidase N-terminal domain-containing protein n=1 Tax=Paenibacillus sp. PK4536 TaxID=3024576 RepID=UPI002359FEC8|nr:copper amine oxidase N-terminal domain-containing protein [Paenibacillus sp. PK4536]WIM37961.1 copper amine oxidase N-terminal domain-containing protein [Paenibacillus sp. PK4536]